MNRLRLIAGRRAFVVTFLVGSFLSAHAAEYITLLPGGYPPTAAPGKSQSSSALLRAAGSALQQMGLGEHTARARREAEEKARAFAKTPNAKADEGVLVETRYYNTSHPDTPIGAVSHETHVVSSGKNWEHAVENSVKEPRIKPAEPKGPNVQAIRVEYTFIKVDDNKTSTQGVPAGDVSKKAADTYKKTQQEADERIKQLEQKTRAANEAAAKEQHQKQKAALEAERKRLEEETRKAKEARKNDAVPIDDVVKEHRTRTYSRFGHYATPEKPMLDEYGEPKPIPGGGNPLVDMAIAGAEEEGRAAAAQDIASRLISEHRQQFPGSGDIKFTPSELRQRLREKNNPFGLR